MKNFLGLTIPLGAETFYQYKLTEVVVIYENKNFKLVALKVMVPSLESFNNGQKLQIMSLTFGLGQNHFF